MSIPEKIFVARSFISGDEVRGYMTDATKDHTKAFKDKKERLEGYAKHNNMPSLILDNVPLNGFAVVQKLSKYARETYFHIRHPEGFEFMVSADNMNDLIAHNDINKGVFKDPMYFNDKLELINGNTKTFAKMEAKQSKEEARKEFVANLKVGDGFKWGTTEFYYCGRVHAICMSKTKEFCLVEKSSPYHMIYNITEQAYILNNNLQKFDLEPKAILNAKINTDDEIAKANVFFQTPVKHKYTSLGDGNNPVLIHNKSFKKKDLKIQYTEISPSNYTDFYFRKNIVFKTTDNDKDYRVFFNITETQSRGGYSYYRNDYDLSYEYNPISRYGSYPVQIDENGIMEMDVDLNEHTSFSSWRGYKSPFYNPLKKYDSYRNNEDRKPFIHISNTKKLYMGTYHL